MSSYSDTDKERMLSYPILSLLASFGKRTDRCGTLFYSPFRDERTASLSINARRNVWYDHGEGRGGNVFTMAQRLLGLPDSRKGEVWDHLAGLDSGVIIEPDHVSARRDSRPPAITIDAILGTIPEFIYGYARSRGVRRSLVARYCRAVKYHVGTSRKAITAIGFPIGEDGWVLRRATDRDVPLKKRCTTCAPTLLGPDGKVVGGPSHGSVIVFEGFFDFLSWLELDHRTLPMVDVCVLNSVSSTKAALPFLLSHTGGITTMLDSDRAGREHTAVIADAAAQRGIPTRDLSQRLGQCKDVNELLVSTRNNGQNQNP